MKRNLKKMFAQKAGTLMIDEELQNDELMIKLRKWKQAKKKLEAEKKAEQLATARLETELHQAQQLAKSAQGERDIAREVAFRQARLFLQLRLCRWPLF